MAKAHERKQFVKRYLARKAKYFANKKTASAQQELRFCSPIRSVCVAQVLSPGTATKIARNRDAALARLKALIEAETAPSNPGISVISVESDDEETTTKTPTCVLCNQPWSDTVESMCTQCQVLALASPKRADVPKSPPKKKVKTKKPIRADAPIKRLKKTPKVYDV